MVAIKDQGLFIHTFTM